MNEYDETMDQSGKNNLHHHQHNKDKEKRQSQSQREGQVQGRMEFLCSLKYKRKERMQFEQYHVNRRKLVDIPYGTVYLPEQHPIYQNNNNNANANIPHAPPMDQTMNM